MPEIVDPEEQDWLRRLSEAGAFDESSAGQNYQLRSARAWDDYIKNVGLLQFPPNLGYDPELQNYMMFDFYDTAGESLEKESSTIPLPENANIAGINVNEAIQASKDQVTQALSGISNNEQNLSATAEVAAKRLTQYINLTSPNTSPELLSAAKQGLGIRSYESASLGFGNRTERINLSIALPIPASISTNYGFEYEDTDFSGLMTLIGAKDAFQQMAVGGQPLTSEGKQVIEKLVSIPSVVIDTISNILGKSDLNLVEALQAKTRKAPSRFKDNVFKGVQRRTFSFEWEFSPRNREDVLKIYAINYAFKKYSHPRRTDGGLYLDYPGQFKIGFYNKLLLNDFLFRIGLCACTKCQITYGKEELTFMRDFTANTGAFSESTSAYGAPPSSVKLALDFTELELLTRERIQQGY